VSSMEQVLARWAQGIADHVPTDGSDPHALPPHSPHCLGCGPDNPHGHQLSVRADGELAVATRHVFDHRHVGAPGIAHGGAVATVLDDLFGFLLYRVNELAVTRHLDVDFHAPVLLEVPYLLRAWVARRDGRKLFVRAEGRDETGRLVATAQALFLVVDVEHFQHHPKDTA
jgi:acyl-coenzyme A thioesterase PaaI-like protein